MLAEVKGTPCPKATTQGTRGRAYDTFVLRCGRAAAAAAAAVVAMMRWRWCGGAYVVVLTTYTPPSGVHFPPCRCCVHWAEGVFNSARWIAKGVVVDGAFVNPAQESKSTLALAHGRVHAGGVQTDGRGLAPLHRHHALLTGGKNAVLQGTPQGGRNVAERTSALYLLQSERHAGAAGSRQRACAMARTAPS